MKVVTDPTDGRVLGVELTRRNIRSLLAKLDGHPPDSACTLAQTYEARAHTQPYPGVYDLEIKAVEDAEHYSDREPGFIAGSTVAAFGCRELGGTCDCVDWCTVQRCAKS